MVKSLRFPLCTAALMLSFGIQAQMQVVKVYKTDGTTEYIPKADVARIVIEEAATLSGEGTQESPYLISSVDDLLLMAEQVNSGDSVYTHGFYKLNADIDLTGIEWTPIAQGLGNTNVNLPEAGVAFLGSFNGDGHTISGLNINATATEAVGLYGLFGLVGSKATIHDLTVKGSVVVSNATEADVNTQAIAGGIVGQGYYCVLTNCTFEGTVKADCGVASGGAVAGGIVGHFTGNMSGCTATIAEGQTISATGYFANAGAVAGYVLAGTVESSSATIAGEVLAQTGDITADDASANAGGLLGFSYGGNVTTSTATIGGTVKAVSVPATGAESALTAAAAGGLVGGYQADQLGSSSVIVNGTVAAEGCGNVYAGGVIGSQNNGGYGASGLAATIAGTVSAVNHNSSGSKSIACAGGVYGQASYQNSYSVLASSHADVTGTISSKSGKAAYAGGVVGGSGSIVGCYANIGATGVITCAAPTLANTGGVVGLPSASLAACYSVVEGKLAVGESKAASIGGVVGGISGTKRNRRQVVSCYTLYTGTYEAPEEATVGAVVGTAGNYVDVLADYWYTTNETLTGTEDYKLSERSETALSEAAETMNAELEGSDYSTASYSYDAESNTLKVTVTAE